MNTSKGIHTHKRTALASLLAGVLLTASCSYREEKAVEQSVVGFAQNYFNLRYQKALNACTPESEKWVRFKATNITQEDVDVYNSKRDTAECDVESIDLDDDKTTAIVEVRLDWQACHYLPKRQVQIRAEEAGREVDGRRAKPDNNMYLNKRRR